MPPAESQPRTPMARHLFGLPRHQVMPGLTAIIASEVELLAIEEQAAAEARRELLAKVEGLPDFEAASLAVQRTTGALVSRAAVLRLIEEQP
jgi:hypothetical protein